MVTELSPLKYLSVGAVVSVCKIFIVDCQSSPLIVLQREVKICKGR